MFVSLVCVLIWVCEFFFPWPRFIFFIAADMIFLLHFVCTVDLTGSFLSKCHYKVYSNSYVFSKEQSAFFHWSNSFCSVAHTRARSHLKLNQTIVRLKTKTKKKKIKEKKIVIGINWNSICLWSSAQLYAYAFYIELSECFGA